MTLFINTSDNKKIVVQLGRQRFVQLIKVGETQKLLCLINQTIKKSNRSINQIDKIKIDLGPGSFTGLRVGVAIANALGWALKIPVNGRKQIVTPVYE